MVDPGKSNPPPPGQMSDESARAKLGKRYALWRNCGVLAKQTGIPFAYVWRAAIYVIQEVGVPPRDGQVIAVADQMRHDEQAYVENMTKRREARRERKQREDQSDEDR